MENLLTVKNLSKSFPQFQLENVCFSLKPRTIMGFIGRNGAGKTTTMKSIVNLMHPSGGEISFFGMSMPEHEFEIKQRIAVVFGNSTFFELKKLQSVTDVYRRFYPTWDEDSYRNYLRLFELDPGKRIKELSQGMKVKYQLALGLSHHAELLILDEPTSGLDPVSRDDLLNVFEDIVRGENASIFFSTHITSDLEHCADEITYIKGGRILASEPKSAFIDRYRLVEGKGSDLTEALRSALIGLREKDGEFSALIETKDLKLADAAKAKPTDLESIMVHIERSKS